MQKKKKERQVSGIINLQGLLEKNDIRTRGIIKNSCEKGGKEGKSDWTVGAH